MNAAASTLLRAEFNQSPARKKRQPVGLEEEGSTESTGITLISLLGGHGEPASATQEQQGGQTEEQLLIALCAASSMC